MGIMEAGLIIAGAVLVVVSFLMKEKETKVEEKEDTKARQQEEMRDMAETMIKDMLENTEAKLDKIANQKIMAVGNYSEDVLKNIEDNHNEVMFLYNMLNDKENTLKNTVRDIEAVKVSVKKMAEEEKQAEKKEKAAGQKETRNQIQPELLEEKQTKKELGESEQRKEILRLYQTGKTNVEIAQILNLGVGEVNLVLGLYKSQETGKDDKNV